MEALALEEIPLTEERIKSIGETAVVLSYLHESVLHELDAEPQNLGMYDPEDKKRACEDPRTIKVEFNGVEIPVLTPIEFHFDANQKLYEGETAYFFNWQDFKPGFEDLIASRIGELPSGALIALERKADDFFADQTLTRLIGNSGRKIELSPKCLDENGIIENVIFYYSDANRTDEKSEGFSDISSAYEGLRNTTKWHEFEKRGVHFISGENIAPHLKEGRTTKLLEDLWAVYDETFNKLIKDHPSDQKIPRDFFDLLTTSPNSKVMYVEDDGEVVCALFVVEDLTDLPWLNLPFYKKLNQSGKTVFMPGVATKLDAKKGVSYSRRLIEAFSFVGQHVPEITGLATQCTNVSAKYIPRMTNSGTRGTMNAQMEEIVKYEYPVYKII